jgi:sugar phosphate isomerase/epimerase
MAQATRPAPQLLRRRFLALASAGTAAALAASASAAKHVPLGLLLFAVRDDLQRDLPGTLRAVARMGYEGVEFFGPYFDWSPAFARQVRSQLDDLHLPCLSTHNEAPAFTDEGLSHAIELNRILGSQSIVCVRGLASAGAARPSPPPASKGFPGEGLDGWKRIDDRLSKASERLRPLNMTCAFHNHAVEFEPVDGARPIDILARNKDLVFHLDIGPCRHSGTDPIAFIDQYPGRIQSVLCSDSPNDASGHPPLVGQGTAPWKRIFAAAESAGGIRFYLIQQEGSADPPLQAVEKDLTYFRQLHG